MSFFQIFFLISQCSSSDPFTLHSLIIWTIPRLNQSKIPYFLEEVLRKCVESVSKPSLFDDNTQEDIICVSFLLLVHSSIPFFLFIPIISSLHGNFYIAVECSLFLFIFSKMPVRHSITCESRVYFFLG